MNVAKNKKIVRAMFDAHKNLDLEGFLAPLADDVKWYYMTLHPAMKDIRSKQQWREALEWGRSRTMDGIRMEVRSITGEGDLVCVEAVARARQLGTGEEYANMVAFFLVFQDGKIIEGRQYNDTWHVDKIIHQQ